MLGVSVFFVLFGCGATSAGSQPVGSGGPEQAEAFVRALQAFETECGAPESAESCGPTEIERTIDRLAPALSGYRTAAAEYFLGRLAHGDRSAARGLEWLRDRRALPILRELLLAGDEYYGWESSEVISPEEMFAPRQFPSLVAYASAISTITGLSLQEAVILTPEERVSLLVRSYQHENESGHYFNKDAIAANWLLKTLSPEVVSPPTQLPLNSPVAQEFSIDSALEGALYVGKPLFPGVFSVSPLALLHNGRLNSVPDDLTCSLLARRKSVTRLDARSEMRFSTTPGRLSIGPASCQQTVSLRNGEYARCSTDRIDGPFMAYAGRGAPIVAEVEEVDDDALVGRSLEAMLVRGAPEPSLVSVTAKAMQIEGASGPITVVEIHYIARAGCQELAACRAQLNDRDGEWSSLFPASVGGAVLVWRGTTLLGQVGAFGVFRKVNFGDVLDVGTQAPMVVVHFGESAFWESLILGETENGMLIVARGAFGTTA